jgi:von Willebrand factor type A domain
MFLSLHDFCRCHVAQSETRTKTTWLDELAAKISNCSTAPFASSFFVMHSFIADLRLRFMWINICEKNFKIDCSRWFSSCQLSRRLSQIDHLFAACPNWDADVVFVVDSSQSIQYSDFQSALSFLTNIVNNFNVSSPWTRFAMVQYSDTANVLFSLTDYASSANSVVNAITSARQGSSSTTNLASALQLALSNLFLLQGQSSATKV